LKLKGQKEWFEYCSGELSGKGIRREDIPSNPHVVYKKQGWKGYGNWLGTETIATRNRKYRPFEEAREFVHGLGLKNNLEWRKYCRGKLPKKGSKPEDIPAEPHVVYKKQGWKGYGDWLGTETISTQLRKYRPFKQAREFAHSLELKGKEEWQKYSIGNLPNKEAKPKDIPSRPDLVYKKTQDWVNWGDWLGTSKTKKKRKS